MTQIRSTVFHTLVITVATAASDFLLLAQPRAGPAARLERVTLDDIARQAQPTPLHPQQGAHHHE